MIEVSPPESAARLNGRVSGLIIHARECGARTLCTARHLKLSRLLIEYLQHSRQHPGAIVLVRMREASPLEKLQLPEDVSRRTVNMVEFPDPETCEHFFPGRSLGFHRTINSLIEREVRSRGGSVSRTVITRSSIQNETEETRRAVAERHYSLSR